MADQEFLARIALDVSRLEAGVSQGIGQLQRFETRTNQIFDSIATDVLSGTDKINDGIKGLRLGGQAQALSALADAAGVFSDVATSAFKAVGGPALNFESELNKTNTILKLSGAELANYQELLRTTGSRLDVASTAAENAKAAYDIASGGFKSAADNAAVLNASLLASKAGSTEAATASNVIVGTLRAYGKSAQEAQQVSDVFFKTVELGITTFPELAQNMGQVNAVAAGTGVSLEEISAALATVTSRGIQTDKAVTGLRGLINRLISPQAQKALKKYGLDIDAASIKSDGLAGTLRKIQGAAGGNVTALREITGDARAFSVALSLLNDTGTLFEQNLKEIENAAGATKNAAQIIDEGLGESLKRLRTQLEDTGTGFVEDLLPSVRKGVDGLTSLAEAVDKIPGPMKLIGGAVAVIGGATAIAIGGITGFVAAVLAIAANVATALPVLTTMGAFLGEILPFAIIALIKVLKGLIVGPFKLLIAALGNIPLLLAAAALGFDQYTRVLENNAKALDRLTNAEARRQAFFNENKDLLKQTADELEASGRTSKEVADLLLALRDQAQRLREEKSPLLPGVLEDIKNAEKLKTELAEREQAARKSKSSSAQPEFTGPVLTDEQVKADDKALKKKTQNFLAEQRLSKDTTRKKIEDLKQFIETEKLSGEQSLSVRREIQTLEGQLAREREAAQREQFDNELSAVKLSHSSDKARLSRLRELAKQEDLNGAQRRRIAQEIFSIESANIKKLEQEREQARKKRDADAKAAKSQLKSEEQRGADLGVQGASQRVDNLKDQAKRGKATQDEIKEAIEDRAKAEIDAVKLEAKQAKEVAKNASVRIQIEKNAALEIKNIRAQADADILESAQQLADREKRIRDKAQREKEKAAKADERRTKKAQKQIQNRVGGAASPLIPLSQLTVGSALPNIGSNFGEFADLGKPDLFPKIDTSKATPPFVPKPTTPPAKPEPKITPDQAKTPEAKDQAGVTQGAGGGATPKRGKIDVNFLVEVKNAEVTDGTATTSGASGVDGRSSEFGRTARGYGVKVQL